MTERDAMAEAVRRARSVRGTTAPNPPVGAVLMRGDLVLGGGATHPVGGPHAEVVALAEARAAGHDPRGATMVVTLEPCCHHGRTPPCTDALLAAGVARVIAGAVDPFPRVAGRGLARLREAGVDVVVVDDAAAAALIAPFAKVLATGLPQLECAGNDPEHSYDAVIVDVARSAMAMTLAVRAPPGPAPSAREVWWSDEPEEVLLRRLAAAGRHRVLLDVADLTPWASWLAPATSRDRRPR